MFSWESLLCIPAFITFDIDDLFQFPMTTRGNKSNMDSTASLSDYSEDFEEYDSSKGGKGSLKHAEVMSTPKRPSVGLPTRTIPGQRKARSQYNRPGRINNFSLGKTEIVMCNT